MIHLLSEINLALIVTLNGFLSPNRHVYHQIDYQCRKTMDDDMFHEVLDVA